MPIRKTAEKKKAAPAKAPAKKAEAEPRRLVATAGREVFAPIPYHTFEVGPLTVDVEMDPAEGAEAAHERALEILDGLFTRHFEAKLTGFFERVARVDEHMVEAGRQPRSQQEVFGKGSSTPAPRDKAPVDEGPANAAGFAGDPRAGEPQSQAQETMLERKAQDAGLDLATETRRIFDCQPRELSRRAASKMIDWLMAATPSAVYRPASRQEPEYTGAPASEGTAPDHAARGLGDMVTAKQLGMIRAVARDARVDPDEECRKLMGCEVDQLGKRSASDLIDHLKAVQEAGVFDQGPAPEHYDGPPRSIREDIASRQRELTPEQMAAAASDDDIPF